MTRVNTGSRLHFGLFRLPPAGPWPAGERYYGGVGMMVERPPVRVAVAPAAEWGASGPLAERALSVARRLCHDSTLAAAARPHHVTVEECAPEHVGLGTGTQLSLAVARALTVSCGGVDLSAAELARQTGRGRRSAIGVHGFDLGGFMVDRGKSAPEELAPLAARADFPDAWRVVLLTPVDATPPWHGRREDKALAAAGATAHDGLDRLAVVGLLPALAAGDLAAFGEALFEFNVRAGEPFRAAQGGAYASGATAEMVAWLRELGVRGAGQSSWGTTVFGIVGDAATAAAIVAAARLVWGEKVTAVVSPGRNVGAGCTGAQEKGGTAR